MKNCGPQDNAYAIAVVGATCNVEYDPSPIFAGPLIERGGRGRWRPLARAIMQPKDGCTAPSEHGPRHPGPEPTGGMIADGPGPTDTAAAGGVGASGFEPTTPSARGGEPKNQQKGDEEQAARDRDVHRCGDASESLDPVARADGIGDGVPVRLALYQRPRGNTTYYTVHYRGKRGAG